jgi:hypothetical protein
LIPFQTAEVHSFGAQEGTARLIRTSACPYCSGCGLSTPVH